MTVSFPSFHRILETLQANKKLQKDPYFTEEKIIRVAAIVFENTDRKQCEIQQRIEYLFVQLDCKQSVTDKFKRRDLLLNALVKCGD